MAKNSQDTNELDSGGGNVEQIREILFGENIRAFDKRFGLVESRLAKDTESLRNAIEKRVLELERLVNEFQEQASDMVGVETSNRDLALNKIELALGQARIDAENRMAEIEDRFASEFKQINVQLTAMHKELTKSLARAELAQNKRSEKLEQDKVARTDLSALFTSLAKNLDPGKTGGRK